MTAVQADGLGLLASQVRGLLSSMIHERDRVEGAFDRPLSMLEVMGEKGFLGIPVPEPCGGSGGGWSETVILVEESAAVESNLAAMLTAHYACISGILGLAAEEQKKLFLPPLAKGEVVGGVALTEPEAGTDLSIMQAKVEKRGQDLLVNGNKCFVTNTGHDMESGVLTFCSHNLDTAAVYIPSSTPGFHLAHRYHFVGWDNLPNHAVVLQDCSLPFDYLIKVDMTTDDWDKLFSAPRLLVCATATGISRACIDEVSHYARERKQCGMSLAGHQSVHFRLADMATSLEMSKAGLGKAASMLDEGESCLKEINMLKLFSTTQLEEIASAAMEMAGGYGYTDDCKLSSLFRDAKGLQLYWGSRERMRMDIADASGFYSSEADRV